MLKIFILVLVFLIQNIWAGSIISGKVTGADGKVPEKADAHITNLGGDVYSPAKTVNVDDDGQFRFELEDGKYYTLFITAANHLGLKIPIISDKNNQSLELNIQLESIAYLDEFKEVKIIGDWNKFSFRSAEEMKVQDDGTFVYELKSDQEKVGYQLLYLDGTGHSVNGTMFDDLEYDGGGDYRSIVKTENGTARIIFDPKKLNKSTSKTFSVNFANSPSLNQVMEIAGKSKVIDKKYYAARREYNNEHKSLVGFKFDFLEMPNFLDQQMKSKDGIVSRYATINYVGLIDKGYNEGDYKRFVSLLKITDPLWALNPFALTKVYTEAFGKEKANKMIAENFDKISSKNVQAKILVLQGMDAKENDNLKLMAEIFDQLESGYPELKRELRWYLGELDPNKAIMKGKQVPDFNVKLIHSEETVSKESMLGKYYLIDFWAVWCGPCRSEMPNLHAAYKEFKSDKFDILSLSFDPKLEAVDKYRKDTWPMPWLHTFVEKGFQNELSKRFEVKGIPKPVLVNSEGIIIATGSELRGENLKKTLAKHLNSAL